MTDKKLIVESAVNTYTRNTTGFGYVDVEDCGVIRFYNSDNIEFQASGNKDRTTSYVTARAILPPQILPSPLPPPVPPATDNEFFYQVGYSTIGEVNDTYAIGVPIQLSNGDITTYSNEVTINDINGDGSEFEVMTAGTYNIRVDIPTASLSVIALFNNGVAIPYTTASTTSTTYTMIDAIVQVTEGDIISVQRMVGSLQLSIRAITQGSRLYSSITFNRLQ